MKKKHFFHGISVENGFEKQTSADSIQNIMFSDKQWVEKKREAAAWYLKKT